MIQVWHGLVDTLRLLPTVNPTDDRRNPNQIQEEKATIQEALEKLSVLISLRKGDIQPPEALSILNPVVSTPLSSSSGAKRKRRPSISASPVPPTAPVQTGLAGASLESTGIVSVSSPLYRAGTPGSRELLGKQRKELYYDQLPLQPGRKVAFKLPAAKSSKEKPGDEEESEDEWILGTIVKSFSQDKLRYEVQDDDEKTKYTSYTLPLIHAD